MRRLIVFSKLAIMIGLVYWLLDSGQIDLTQLLEQPFSSLHVVGIIVIIGNFMLTGYRWFLLLRVQLPDVRALRVIKWGWIGEFFNMVTPGGGGGELARSYYAIKHHPEARIAAFSSVVLDRLIGLVALLALGFVSYGMLVLTGRQMTPVTHYLGSASGVLLAGVVLVSAALMMPVSRRLFRRFISHDLAQAMALIMQTYWQRKTVAIYCFLLSLVCHLLLIFAFWIAAGIFVVQMDYLSSVLVVPLTLVANLLPVSPGGMGVGETAATYMFAQFNVINGAGLMALVRVWMMILQLAGGLWYLFDKDGQKTPEHIVGRVQE